VAFRTDLIGDQFQTDANRRHQSIKQTRNKTGKETKEEEEEKEEEEQQERMDDNHCHLKSPPAN